MPARGGGQSHKHEQGGNPHEREHEESSQNAENDNSLKEKLVAETKRLAKGMKGKEANEILARAIQNVLGIDLSAADLDAANAGRRELAPDALEDAAGGFDFWEFSAEAHEEFDNLVDNIKDFFKNLF